MAVTLGKNLIPLLGVTNTRNVDSARLAQFSVQTQYNDERGQLGNPNQPETRVAGLRGDNVYYFA